MADEQARLGQVVLHLWWSDGSLPRQETYGPWTVADDGEAHLAQVWDFLSDWTRVTGCRPAVATLAIAMDPDEWVRQRESASG